METLKANLPEAIDRLLVPYHDRIIVDRDTPARFTASGFEIPGSFLPKPNTGIILSVGKRVQEVTIGQYILFGRNSGTDITINEHTYVIMNEAAAVLQIDPLVVFGNRVLIKPSEAPKMIKGIHIPDTVHDQPQTGVVAHIGRLVDEVEVGENVLYGKFAGMPITVQGVEYLCIRQEDVFAHLD